MPTTKRELALAGALAALQNITGIAGLVVERNRRDPVEDYPSIVLRDGGHSIERETITQERIDLRIEVELYARAGAGEDIGSKLSELYGAAKAALVADPSLGGVAFQSLENGMSDPTIDTTDAAAVVGGAVVSFVIEVWAASNSPY